MLFQFDNILYSNKIQSHMTKAWNACTCLLKPLYIHELQNMCGVVTQQCLLIIISCLHQKMWKECLGAEMLNHILPTKRHMLLTMTPKLFFQDCACNHIMISFTPCVSHCNFTLALLVSKILGIMVDWKFFINFR